MTAKSVDVSSTDRVFPTSREVAIDVAPLVIVSLAICVASAEVGFMTALVVTVAALRFVARLAVHRGPRLARRGMTEAVYFGICTLVGGFNDWNTVVMQNVYEYTVPAYWPDASSIPLWMLLYWGLILRGITTLFQWQRLRPRRVPSEAIRLPGRFIASAPRLKVGLQLLLCVATRAVVYENFADPIWSWIPMLIALACYAYLFPLDARRLFLLLLLVSVGPAVEVLYIQVGGLHRYALGWFGGVPAWIVVWWGVAGLVWEDIGARIQRRLEGDGDGRP